MYKFITKRGIIMLSLIISSIGIDAQVTIGSSVASNSGTLLDLNIDFGISANEKFKLEVYCRQ